MLFGYQYPRSLPDWSSDDWMTKVGWGMMRNAVFELRAAAAFCTVRVADALHRTHPRF